MKNRRRYVPAIITCIAVLSILLSACSSSAPKTSPSYGMSATPAPGSANQAPQQNGGLFNQLNQEDYNHYDENRFFSVSERPLSTFAADVDTASYSNIRRFIADGQLPPSDAVRIEEMVNYFEYDYPEPEDGEPFSVTTELADCPWNEESKLLLIGLQAKSIDMANQPPSNLVFLIDVSGSMQADNRLPLVKRSFQLLVEYLRPDDVISIVTYASSDRVVLQGAYGSEKQRIIDAIQNLNAGGGTAGSKGITTAYEVAQQYFIDGGNNRIILATDGDLNIGITSDGELKKLVQSKRDMGVFLSVLGYGMGNLKDSKMQTLAENGKGNYAYISDIYEARRVLVEEIGSTLYPVAKDVKFQVEFNPAHVEGYRLIGYESRILKDNQFSDDRVDGGTIGSGHRVTVLYELIPAGSDFSGYEPKLKYSQKEESAERAELLTISIRYKEPNENKSTLLSYPITAEIYSETPSDNLIFAAAVVETGMLLKNSEYSGSSSFDMVIEQIASTADYRFDSLKREFGALVEQIQRLKD